MLNMLQLAEGCIIQGALSKIMCFFPSDHRYCFFGQEKIDLAFSNMCFPASHFDLRWKAFIPLYTHFSLYLYFCAEIH